MIESIPLDAPFFHLALALGLGLLVGLQRERIGTELAGIRTFALVSVIGAVAGILSQELGGWVVAGALLSLTFLILLGVFAEIRKRGTETDVGMTTEVALLAILLVGVLAGRGSTALATVVGGATALLLHLKARLHEFAGRLDDRDIKAIMQFALVSLVILPVLPNRTFGPYDVINPRQVWWMVVLIVGLSLAGYVAYRLLGARVGTLAGGLLGGLISSTATTVSYARRSGSSASADRLAALAILLASAVLMARVIVELAVVASDHLLDLVWPLAISGVVGLAMAVVIWARSRGGEIEGPETKNPSELKTALVFAALYVVVLLLATAAQDRFGDRGLYVVAVLSGLTDMDAITLSTARMLESATVTAEQTWKVILVAATANLVFKGAAVAVLGSRGLLWRILLTFGIIAAANLLLVWLW
jgi:uncharacterized membrane protein (DUF4010 family)